MGSVRIRVPAPLRELRQRFRDGGAVSLDEVFDAAELTQRERYVLVQRVMGRSAREIGLDPQMGVSEPTVRKVEGEALYKIGVDRQTVTSMILDPQRDANALSMLERCKGVRIRDLHTDAGVRRKTRVWLTSREKELVAAANALLAASRAG